MDNNVLKITMNWDSQWSENQLVNPILYTYYSTVWNSVSGKWNKLT